MPESIAEIEARDPAAAEKIRAGWRERSNKRREKERATIRYGYNDWSWYEVWHSKRHEEARANVSKFAEEFAALVEAELGLPARPDQCDPFPGRETLDRVSFTLFSLRKGTSPYLQMTFDAGLIAGGIMPVGWIGRPIVEGTHKFNLERSAIYSAGYRELLDRLQKLEPDKNDDRASRAAVDAELAGTFQYIEPQPPKKPEPVVAPPKVEPLPSHKDFMEAQAEKLFRQISEDQAAKERREQMVNEGLLPPGLVAI